MDEASFCSNFHWKLVNCPAIYFFTLRSNAFTFALEWEVNGHWTLIQNLQYEVQANIRQQAAVSPHFGSISAPGPSPKTTWEQQILRLGCLDHILHYRQSGDLEVEVKSGELQ